MGSSKILNVQILDAASVRLVTGLPPPPTPVSAETYAENDLPFYRMWRAYERHTYERSAYKRLAHEMLQALTEPS